MVARGFRTEIQGVTMHRPNDWGYSRPGSLYPRRLALAVVIGRDR